MVVAVEDSNRHILPAASASVQWLLHFVECESIGTTTSLCDM